ncbi:hypothetical protein Tco_1174046 [Tanacetum coccineum]
MEISIADQIALDDALVAPADRLKIGKCNLRLSSDVTSKEATLQVGHDDVLKLTPFYKAFQVTADAPEIYMQEFWATAYVHNRSVRFKMNNKKHILGLDQFRDILQICPKVGNKKFEEPPLEKEILSLSSLAQILWGMYNKKNVDYAYLLWEDFIFQIENKNMKKGNAMYYLVFTNLVRQLVMDKDPSIPRERNKDIRISESYKEYHAIASGKIPPKTKGVHRNPEIKGHSFDPNLVNPPPPPCNGQQTRVSDHLASSPNMLNPNQDTGFDDIFGQHTEATSLIDTPVTAIVEPSFTAQTNRPPTPNPLIIQIQQPPILTPANTTSSSLQNLPNFASLFGFDYRLKALEGQLLRTQTKQIIMLNALSSIPGGR